MKFKFLAFLILFINFLAFSQNEIRCKTSGNPLTRLQENQLLQYRKQNLQAGSQNRLEQTVVTVPVVFHIIYSKPQEYFTYDQVLKQLEVLNNDFRRHNADTVNTPVPFRNIAGDAGIEFVLAKQDPGGNPCDGITYRNTTVTSFTDDRAAKRNATGGTDAWNTVNYLNIWVCNYTEALGLTESDKGTIYSGILVNSKTFSTYGPLLSSKFNLGRTVTHETGHWFGLIHIWGDSECGDDQVNDTPIQANATSDNIKCPPFPYRPVEDARCEPNAYGRNFSNFLDYSQDGCMNMFSQGQVNRMRSTLFAVRPELLVSPGLFAPFKNDLALVQIPNDSSFLCNSTTDPEIKVRIKNNGSETITGYRISVKTGPTQKIYDSPDSLAPGADKIVSINLGEKLDNDSNKLEITCNTLTTTDEYLANNSKTLSYKCFFPLLIYPNPVSEVLYLKSNVPKLKRAKLYNLEGQEVLSTEYPHEINVSSLKEGYYTLFIETDKGNERHKIIVSHN